MEFEQPTFYPLVMVGEVAPGMFEGVGFMPSIVDGDNRYPRFIKEYGDNPYTLQMWLINEIGRQMTRERADELDQQLNPRTSSIAFDEAEWDAIEKAHDEAWDNGSYDPHFDVNGELLYPENQWIETDANEY